MQQLVKKFDEISFSQQILSQGGPFSIWLMNKKPASLDFRG